MLWILQVFARFDGEMSARASEDIYSSFFKPVLVLRKAIVELNQTIGPARATMIRTCLSCATFMHQGDELK